MSSFIDVITFGKVKEKYIQSGIDEFEKRLTRFAKVKKIILPDKGIDENSKRALEFQSSFTYLLDPAGDLLVSEKFSDLISVPEEKLTFIIAGAEGFTDDVKNAMKRISLSPMTFTHEMAQLLLIEQIYRAYTIKKGIPYHK